LINSAQNIGGFIGLPMTPYASDILGRRAALFLGSVIMLAGVAVQITASTVKIFIAARVIIGFGLTFCTNAAPLLLIELSYPTQRGKITALYNSSWYFGSVLVAWVCYGSFLHMGGDWSWRTPTLLQATIPTAQVLLIWFIPESPRYLVSKGLEGKASRILAKYHANGGGEHDPLVVFELAQIRHAIRMEQEISQDTSFKSLFTTPGNRKRMRIIIAIACFSQWSGNGLVSYYINLVLEGVGITRTETKAAINGGLQVFNLVVAYTASLLVDWVGRRPLFIISNTGMLISFGLWTVTEALFNELKKTAAAKATIPLIFIYYLFYDLAYSPMLVAYTLEILPYRIRAKGFAVMNLTVFLTVAFNQFVNPWALEAIGWWYYIVYCGWLILELVFVLTFIVETKGRTLEETAALFDGEQPQEDLANMGGAAATMSMTTRSRLGVTVTVERHEDSMHSSDDLASLPEKRRDSYYYEMEKLDYNRASPSSPSTSSSPPTHATYR
ncbi:hypothetical protein AAF712_011217, partial [Marasmius tenuissimus]